MEVPGSGSLQDSLLQVGKARLRILTSRQNPLQKYLLVPDLKLRERLQAPGNSHLWFSSQVNQSRRSPRQLQRALSPRWTHNSNPIISLNIEALWIHGLTIWGSEPRENSQKIPLTIIHPALRKSLQLMMKRKLRKGNCMIPSKPLAPPNGSYRLPEVPSTLAKTPKSSTGTKSLRNGRAKPFPLKRAQPKTIELGRSLLRIRMSWAPSSSWTTSRNNLPLRTRRRRTVFKICMSASMGFWTNLCFKQ